MFIGPAFEHGKIFQKPDLVALDFNLRKKCDSNIFLLFSASQRSVSSFSVTIVLRAEWMKGNRWFRPKEDWK